MPQRTLPLLLILPAALLSACGGQGWADPEAFRRSTGDQKERNALAAGSIFGEGGLTIGGGRERDEVEAAGIGVNSYLWRASLDTMSFMPVTSADPFGGVITTDWYTLPGSPDERFKVNTYILDRQLRADGVRVSVFRQVRDQFGGWTDAAVDPSTATELENTILTRARELRVASVGS